MQQGFGRIFRPWILLDKTLQILQPLGLDLGKIRILLLHVLAVGRQQSSIGHVGDQVLAGLALHQFLLKARQPLDASWKITRLDRGADIVRQLLQPRRLLLAILSKDH